MDAHGMRRKDTTKGPPLRILTLDGGGVRGYSMLILLQELMHRTFVETEGRAPKRHEIPKPCEHFDIIAGTGTGGLIAIMLGRLRLDLETCKDVYVRMTKRVFETDKTIAGIPYRSTLFKASKLEDAIRECVRQHTVDPDEGNDMDAESSLDVASPLSPMVPGSAYNAPHRTASSASRYSQIGTTPVNYQRPLTTMRLGNPNALLYDRRENRCKTAVTAVYKGTPRGGSSILLRSYDSRKEPAPEFNCTIWQAGRATAATGLAFKPIQIGQSVFLDEGAGKYNPAPQILDEAVCNEYPGRDVGVFISIGTGKRPPGTNQQQHLWWEGFVASGMGDFAEARRRLINKIEGCEETHQYMLKEHLARRQVNQENYYRLNVEVGVGEFGMNEWNRLADISTNTRMYLAKHEVQSMNLDAASKLARIHRAKQRWDRAMNGSPMSDSRFSYEEESSSQQIMSVPPPSNPIAVELPAEDVMPPSPRRPHNADLLFPSQYHRRRSSDEKMVIFSDELPEVIQPRPRGSGEYRRSTELDASNHRGSNGSIAQSPRRSAEDPRVGGDMQMRSPPPVPPKTPLPYPVEERPLPPPPPTMWRPQGGGVALPYPDTDGPPPVVNMARKPEFGVR